MPSALTTLIHDGPSAATSEMASKMSGNAILASIRRETNLSAERKKPATRPSAMPSTLDTITTEKPTISDSRPP
ncbi:hypothetical protein G6F24_018747 [Rhizopus arrhizus]|nr:hypothetical protein G6F24_018747 [Rhizopus arrhizus]